MTKEQIGKTIEIVFPTAFIFLGMMVVGGLGSMVIDIGEIYKIVFMTIGTIGFVGCVGVTFLVMPVLSIMEALKNDN